MNIYRWVHWCEPSQDLLGFCLSLNVLLKCSCAVWRLCDLVPGEAEWTNQHHPAGRALAISGFKSVVLVMSIAPETKRTTQTTCLAKEIID